MANSRTTNSFLEICLLYHTFCSAHVDSESPHGTTAYEASRHTLIL